jgi:hypothetical protein
VIAHEVMVESLPGWRFRARIAGADYLGIGEGSTAYDAIVDLYARRPAAERPDELTVVGPRWDASEGAFEYVVTEQWGAL